MSELIEDRSQSKLCILHAAAQLFAKLGLDKCSTREIAKESKANISSISYYFGGKDGLYKEVLRSYALEVKEKMQGLILESESREPSRESFESDVDKMVEYLIYFRLKNPEIAKIFAREKLTGFPHAKDIHEEIFYPMAQSFFKLFKVGQKKGFIRSDIDAAVFFVTLTEGVWGYFEISECPVKLGQDCAEIKKDITKLKQQILSIYLRGVLI